MPEVHHNPSDSAIVSPPTTVVSAAWSAAAKYGPLAIALTAAVWVLWERDEESRRIERSSVESLRTELATERQYIRGELTKHIDKNTAAYEGVGEALRELTDELRRK
ncbi:MAG: hypothetical protein AAF449_12475 [Myxococcota bacterium]